MSKIITSSKPEAVDESKIIDSSRPGFVSSFEYKKKQQEENLAEAKDIAKGKKIVKETLEKEMKEKTTKDQEKEAMNLIKSLVKTGQKRFTNDDLRPGSLLFFKYDAKDKEATYDKTPLSIVLSRSRGYILGLNLHWTPVVLRVTFMKLLFKMNKQNIAKGRPIELNYRIVKPLIDSLGLGPVIRLYIRSRMSRSGVVVPQDLWLVASKLRAENFNNGKSANAAYNDAIKNFKRRKAINIRKNKRF